VQLAESAAEDGEVLAGDVHEPAQDGALAGHHAVAGDRLALHPETVGAVHGIRRHLLERVRVEQLVDPLTRGQLALLVLFGDSVRAAGRGEIGAALAEGVDLLLHGWL
jgi:hypothetical protein